MSTDPPGAPAPREPAAPGADEHRPARFRAGVEQVEDTTQPAQSPGHRRFLDDPDPDAPKAPRRTKVRARKVRRVVRHIEPWSVLKISVLFFLSLFLIICVAATVLWNGARTSGAIDDVESFITSLGFGNCEAIDGDILSPDATSTTVAGPEDQLGGGEVTSTTLAVDAPEGGGATLPDEDGKCDVGQRLVGGFEFEDQRIFQAFALGGVVLVLAGAAASVVMVLLFNLISDLTGGVGVTVLEEEPTTPRTGSPPSAGRD